MRLSQLSIRAVLLLTIGALTALILLLAGVATVENTLHLNRLVALKDASLFSDELSDAMETIALERDVSLSVLETSNAGTLRALSARLSESRKASDAALGGVQTRLQGLRPREAAAIRDVWLGHFRAIRALRARTDGAARLPKARRDAGLAREWSREIAQLTAESGQHLRNVLRQFAGIDPVAAQHLRFKRFLRTIITNVGHERSVIGLLIGEGRGPTPAQIAELSRRQGGSDLSWDMSRRLAEDTGLYDAIASPFSDAASHYATMREMIGDLYVLQSGTASPYPIGVDLWLELSAQVSDSLMTLRDAASRATRAHVETLVDEARGEIALQGAIFAVALLICLYSFQVVFRRVVGPINMMIDALVRATRGENVPLSTFENRSDEIGKLSDVLRVFRDNAAAIERAAIQLERSQSELRAVVDHAVDGLVTLDAAGAIKSFNPACERIFGYAEEDVAGRDFRMLLPTAEDGVPEAELLSDKIGITGTAGRELTAKRKDGSIFPIDLSVSAFTLDGAQHFSGIVRDVTVRKEAEQQALRHTQALERSNKELDDFAYIASHDLKEPLRGLHNHARFLLEDNADKLDKESIERLERLVFLSQRMERLVNDLLYFSRLGRQELAIQPTDLGAVIADIESTIEDFLKERGARIAVPASLPTVVCDKPRVTELLRNLVTNAVKYNDKQDKVVEIGVSAGRRTPAGHTATAIYVRDNGRGIDPRFHTEIFRIFKRLQGGKEAEEGTGVGLTFVKKIVERHGGTIWLESELGKGTTFYFTLEAPRDGRKHDTQAAA